MAKFAKMYYLLTCFVIVTCKPTNTFEKTVSQLQVDNGGSVQTVAHGQLTTYSFAGYSQFNINNVEAKLYDLMASLFRNLKYRFPLIYIDPKVIFGPFFDVPAYSGIPSNRPPYLNPGTSFQTPTKPNSYPNKPINEQTPQWTPSATPQYNSFVPDMTTRAGTTKIIPSTRRTEQTIRTQATTTKDPLEFTTLGDDDDGDDDDDDYVRPIVLRDAKSLVNEVFDYRPRTSPSVDHGSVQAGE